MMNKNFKKLNNQFWKLKTFTEKLDFWKKNELDKFNPDFRNPEAAWEIRLERWIEDPDAKGLSRTQIKNDKTKHIYLQPDTREDYQSYNSYRSEQLLEMDNTLNIEYLKECFYDKDPINFDDYKKEEIAKLENEMKNSLIMSSRFEGEVEHYGHHARIESLRWRLEDIAKVEFLYYLKGNSSNEISFTKRQQILLLKYLGFLDMAVVQSINQTNQSKLIAQIILKSANTVEETLRNIGSLKPTNNSEKSNRKTMKDLIIVMKLFADTGLADLAKVVNNDIKKYYPTLYKDEA